MTLSLSQEAWSKSSHYSSRMTHSVDGIAAACCSSPQDCDSMTLPTGRVMLLHTEECRAHHAGRWGGGGCCLVTQPTAEHESG